MLDDDSVLTMYAGTNFGSVTRSTDGGMSWGSFNGGIPFSDPRLFYAPFVQDSTAGAGGDHPLYYGSNRLYRSSMGGAWVALSPVLATGDEPEIVTAASTSAHIAAGTGQNVITAIAVAPSDPNRVYLGYYGGELFRSNPAPCDAPGCWVEIDTGLPANAVAIEPSVPNRVYLGLDSGPDGASLYRSLDGGGSWGAFAAGLPNAPVDAISIDETHGRIYAATHGRGAFVLGKPFLSNFEGWVNDRIWDIPVYGQNFLPNQGTCTLSILQSNGSVCASGTVDVMGGTIETDGSGVLQTSRVSMYQGRKVAWACFNGDCIGHVPIQSCYDDADGDGDPDPLSTVTVVCGGQLATATVIGCPQLDNPPSSLAELGLAELGAGPLGRGGGGGPQATPGARGGVLHLMAIVQRRVGSAPLCTVAVPYRAGEAEETVLVRARDAVAASPTCAANGVQAELDLGRPGPSEDEFARPPPVGPVSRPILTTWSWLITVTPSPSIRKQPPAGPPGSAWRPVTSWPPITEGARRRSRASTSAPRR